MQFLIQNWPLFLAVLFLVFLYIFLFLNERKQTQLDRQIEEVVDFEHSKYLDLKEVRIHYRQFGSGHDLLMLHGIGASTYIWRFMIPDLEKHFRITVIDLPGFGLSSKNPKYNHGLDQQCDSILQFLNALNIQKTYLVGSSMGGAIALWLARKSPERFPKVVGLSPATDPKLTKKLKLTRLRRLGKAFRYFMNEVTMSQLMGRVVYHKELVNKESIKNYLLPYLDDGSSILCFMDAFDQCLKDKRLPDGLRSLRSEVLLLWGEKDRLTPIKYAKELQSVLGNPPLYIHPNAGHHMMEDEPNWTCQHIYGFLKVFANQSTVTK